MEADFQSTVRNWLVREIDERKLNRKAIGEALGLNQSAITRMLNGERQISGEEMVRLGGFLSFPESFRGMLNQLMPGVEVKPEDTYGYRYSADERRHEIVERESRRNPLRDEPLTLQTRMMVTATSKGDASCDFYINLATETFTIRPPGYRLEASLIALKVRGDGLAPRHRDGELIFAVNARGLFVGAPIICELLHGVDTVNAVPVRVGIISAFDDTTITLQHSDGSEHTISLSQSRSIYQICDWNSIFRV